MDEIFFWYDCTACPSIMYHMSIRKIIEFPPSLFTSHAIIPVFTIKIEGFVQSTDLINHFFSHEPETSTKNMSAEWLGNFIQIFVFAAKHSNPVEYRMKPQQFNNRIPCGRSFAASELISHIRIVNFRRTDSDIMRLFHKSKQYFKTSWQHLDVRINICDKITSCVFQSDICSLGKSQI